MLPPHKNTPSNFFIYAFVEFALVNARTLR
jgi:hypothetical protein